ncbi:metallophosphoesterase family protein [Gordonia mangrovi]|uniref:metallophosphoesterase family protein n=1 Tax=Gordonia mangrovi TaxID=2665643 RepID=UPI001925C0F8|nr:metallophosphoesterase [Gordonia mangrovi]UVF77457.1 metallophosphoesterase [Gordonia mangrovi]
MTVPLFELPGFAPPGDASPAHGSSAPVGETAHEVTFLHTADWQLGMTRHYLDADAAHAYTAARHEAVERIGTLAAEVDAEFVVVSGDVFEDHRVSSKIVRRTLDALAGYGIPVYLLPGNHDPFDAAGIYRSRTFAQSCPDNVTVLSGAGVHRVRGGVELVAAPWSHKQPGADLVAAQVAGLPPADTIRIMVGHGGVDALTPGGDEALIGLSTLENAVNDGLLDYVALGDRHSVTSVGATGRVWYPGAHEVTNFDHIEQQPGHVLAVTLRRTGSSREVDVVPHRVGQWSFQTISADIAGRADIEALRTRLDDIPDKPRVVLRLRLVGSVSVTEGAVLDELLDECADRFASVTRPDGPDDLVVVADDADLDDLGVGGYVREAAEELFERTGCTDVDEARTARDALALLHRLTGRTR